MPSGSCKVVTNKGQYASLECYRSLHRLTGITANRLLAEDCFTSGGGTDQLKVHHVWRGDADRLHVRVGDDLAPVGRVLPITEVLLGGDCSAPGNGPTVSTRNPEATPSRVSRNPERILLDLLGVSTLNPVGKDDGLQRKHPCSKPTCSKPCLHRNVQHLRPNSHRLETPSNGLSSWYMRARNRRSNLHWFEIQHVNSRCKIWNNSRTTGGARAFSLGCEAHGQRYEIGSSGKPGKAMGSITNDCESSPWLIKVLQQLDDDSQ